MFMLRPNHPEVLGPDWLPPTPLHRRTEVERARRLLADGHPGGGPSGVAVVGSSGSGTSTVARWAVRLVAEDLPRITPGERPLIAAVRVRQCHGAQGVATALLQRLDAGFNGRGFHVTEIMAGFLRRLRREGRPTFILLDDLGPAVGDLSLVIRALTEPDRFLPEGEEELPPCWVTLAGPPEATGVWTALARCRFPAAHRVTLQPYSATARAEILADRAQRALGRSPPPEWLGRVLHRVERQGLGIAAAMEVLRHELVGPVPWSIATSSGQRETNENRIEPHLLAALARIDERRPVTIAELRRWEAESAQAAGARPLPATTFWRRIVRLESIGVVHREVRSGGPGGTRSVVGLLQPIRDPGWKAAPLEIPRADGWVVPSRPEWTA
ncbi:MAG: hypothetical protein L3K17_09905 [Thermoplasmata archaeon]|nr:hypothetical protein [Thermoplasmata archaeon]